MFKRKTTKPAVVETNDYVIIGSIDHGFEIPGDSIARLINSLDGINALMMESPE